MLFVAGIPDGLDFALDPAGAKSARDDDAGDSAQFIPAVAFFQVNRMDESQIQLDPLGDGGMLQCLAHAHVGILQFDIFADQGHLDGRSFPVHCLHQRLPFRPIRFAAGFQPQPLHQIFCHTGFFEQQRDLVDIIGQSPSG